MKCPNCDNQVVMAINADVEKEREYIACVEHFKGKCDYSSPLSKITGLDIVLDTAIRIALDVFELDAPAEATVAIHKFSDTRPNHGQMIEARGPSGEWHRVQYFDGTLVDSDSAPCELGIYGDRMAWRETEEK